MQKWYYQLYKNTKNHNHHHHFYPHMFPVDYMSVTVAVYEFILQALSLINWWLTFKYSLVLLSFCDFQCREFLAMYP